MHDAKQELLVRLCLSVCAVWLFFFIGQASAQSMGTLSASVASSTEIDLSWTETYPYEDYSAVVRDGAWIGYISSGGPYSYADTGLTPNTTYDYSIYISNGDYGYYGNTNDVYPTTYGPPNAPSGLTATGVSTAVNLSWTNNGGSPTAFAIYRATGSCSGFTEVTTVAASAATYSDSGLSSSTTYCYEVEATNSWGTSAASNQASGTTGSATAAPSGLIASTYSSGEIDLAWTNNALATQTAVLVERSLTSGSGFSQIASLSATASTYSDTGLSASTTYYYRVRVNSAVGYSGYSSVASATTSASGGASNTTEGSVNYTYDPFGNLIETNANGVVTTMNYDARGRKSAMTDPDMGSWTYTYDAAGDLVQQVDGKGQTTNMTYDQLARLIIRTEPDLTSKWYYDAYYGGGTCSDGIGKLCEATSSDSYSRTYTYDGLGRLSQIVESIDTGYTLSYGYDSTTGRLLTTTYPTGFVAANVYNSYGYLYEVTNNSSTVFWHATAMDAMGHVTTATFGNGLTAAQSYDVMGREITNTVANGGTNLQNLSYTYDTLSNLTTRTDGYEGITENFYYDSLNRLNQSSGSGLTTHNFDYDARGDLVYKSDVGTYTYGNGSGGSPHAVTSISGSAEGVSNPSFTYDANGNLTAGLSRTLTYMSFNMPATITAPNLLASGTNVAYCYNYNNNHERVKYVVSLSSTSCSTPTNTTIYLHPGGAGTLLFEKEIEPTITEYRHYLMAGGVLIGMYITRSDSSIDTRYFHQDQLGSLTLITSSSGAVCDRMAYDAWGKRRYPNGTDDSSDALYGLCTDRGFTQHEMLDEMALIHMNGRLYDPVLARFQTADSDLQFPDELQSYNRYSYILNNPFAGTDPSGHLGHFFDHGIAKFVPAIVGIVASFYLGPEVASALFDTEFASATAEYGSAELALAESGSTIATTSNFVGAAIGGAVGGAITSGNLQGTLQGAASAGLFYEAGSIADSQLPAGGGSSIWNDGGVGRAAVNAGAGCISGAISGGGCGSQSLAAGFGELVGGNLPKDMDNVATRAVIGGTVSAIGGGNFANGAMTEAFQYLYDDKVSDFIAGFYDTASAGTQPPDSSVDTRSFSFAVGKLAGGLIYGGPLGEEETAVVDAVPAVGDPLFQPGPYAGESISAQSAAQTFTPAERAAINNIGYSTGCHSCGTTDPGTVSGNFVPDHQPVSALNTTNAPQQLYPQCLDCSRQQGLATARSLKTGQQ